MKKFTKNGLITLMILAFVLSFAGCSSSSDDKDEKDQEEKTEASEDKDEDDADEEEETTPETTEETTEATEATEAVNTISVGDTVSNDTIELTLTNVEMVDVVVPPNPPTYYNYFPSGDDETIFLLEADVKNISNTAISWDESFMEVLLVYDGTYEYDSASGGFTIRIDNEGDFTYFNTTISPLSSEHMYYLYYLPNEVAESDAPLEAYITLYGGGEFLYTVR